MTITPPVIQSGLGIYSITPNNEPNTEAQNTISTNIRTNNENPNYLQLLNTQTSCLSDLKNTNKEYVNIN